MLTKKSKYALKAMLYMARKNELVKIADLAKDENIPHKFLETILLELKRGGILMSKTGKQGGYELRQKPNEISFGQIIRLIDGPLAIVPCVSHLYYKRCEECIDETTCEVRKIMKVLRDQTSKILDGTTLEMALQNKIIDL
jgi:Rrf2 family protein